MGLYLKFGLYRIPVYSGFVLIHNEAAPIELHSISSSYNEINFCTCVYNYSKTEDIIW